MAAIGRTPACRLEEQSLSIAGVSKVLAVAVLRRSGISVSVNSNSVPGVADLTVIVSVMEMPDLVGLQAGLGLDRQLSARYQAEGDAASELRSRTSKVNSPRLLQRPSNSSWRAATVSAALVLAQSGQRDRGWRCHSRHATLAGRNATLKMVDDQFLVVRDVCRVSS
jgi:hypothetical protein